MKTFIDYLFQYQNSSGAKVIRSIIIVAFIILFVSCTYTAFRDENNQPDIQSSKRENAAEIIPTGMSLPNLHTIENIITGNPEFDAVEDILKTYGALPYLRQLKTATLILPTGNGFNLETCKYFEVLFAKNGTKGIIEVLQAHTIEGRYDKATIVYKNNAEQLRVTSLNNKTITFLSDVDGVYVVSDSVVRSKIKIFNQMATNGIVHGIEHWLLPSCK